MTRAIGTFGRTCGGALLLAAGLAACGDSENWKTSEARIDELRRDVDKAAKDLDRTNEALKAAREDSRALRENLAQLGERVAAVESRPAASAPSSAEGSAGPAKLTPEELKAQSEEVDALLKKIFSGEATEEEEQRFWELARTTGRVDELIKSLEAKVKEAPGDIPARLGLAQAYLAKLLTLPDGPEKGIWAMKAEGQWKKVLEADPDHWEARYSLAFNWSMWPDFLNKTPDAIREFEKLKEVQERGPAGDHQADTYFQLSRLYLKQGKRDKAQEILKTGLARHPASTELRKALDALAE